MKLKPIQSGLLGAAIYLCGALTGLAQDCEHSPLQTGVALSASCGACESLVISAELSCGQDAWTNQCVSKALELCCSHSAYEVGDFLDPSCGTCETVVVDQDSYCGATAWDEACVDKALELCGEIPCPHGPYEIGQRLDRRCGWCEDIVIAIDPSCEEVEWDETCVELAGELCSLPCSHSPYEFGDSLDSSCGACEAEVIATDPYCGSTEWDNDCVSATIQICGDLCPHSAYEIGSPLDTICGDCATLVISADPFCGAVEWDERCVALALGRCGDPCTHSAYETGVPLDSSCGTCEALVIDKDLYCRDIEWDDECVLTATAQCQLGCLREFAAELSDNWFWLDWLRYFNLTYDPWVYHLQHGFLYPFCGPNGVVFWDNQMQAFWWTSPSLYPYVYRFSDGVWLWYLLDSVAPRWFVRLSDGIWEQWPPPTP